MLIVAVPVVGKDPSLEDTVTVPIEEPPPTETEETVEVTVSTGAPVTWPSAFTGIVTDAVPLEPVPRTMVAVICP